MLIVVIHNLSDQNNINFSKNNVHQKKMLQFTSVNVNLKFSKFKKHQVCVKIVDLTNLPFVCPSTSIIYQIKK